MKNKKYEFTDEVFNQLNYVDCDYSEYGFTGPSTEKYCKLRRIRALRDIGSIKKGTLGGWIESEENLSQEGDCWVGDNAKVFDEARVYEDAHVMDNAIIRDYAKIHGKALCFGNAMVRGSAEVYDGATLSGKAFVSHDAKVYGYAKVRHDAAVIDKAKVYGNSIIRDSARIYGTAEICDNARIIGDARLYDGVIQLHYDYVCVGPLGSRHAFTTLNLVTGTICTGCFRGTLDEFKQEVYRTHGNNKFAEQYNCLIDYFKSILKK